MKESGPRSLKIARRIGGAKSFLHKFGPFCFRPTKQRVEQFNFRKSTEERQDHWLNRQVIATRREGVAPRFQIMRQWDVPLTERRRGILVITESHNLRHLFLQIRPVERQLR